MTPQHPIEMHVDSLLSVLDPVPNTPESCLGGVTYALGANDRGVTGAWESFVPLTPE